MLLSNTNLLADASISGQYISILKDGQVGRRGFTDLQHTAPLSEVCPVLLVLSTALRQPVQTYTPTHKQNHASEIQQRFCSVCEV